MRRLTFVLTAMALLVVAGCSTESGPVEVTSVDFAYEGLPATVAAGTQITMTNASATEVHEFVAIRLADDETRSVEELVALPPEEMAALFPNVATVLVAAPGEEAVAVEGDGTLTEPGRYAIICVIPTGADPQEYFEAAAASEGGPPDVEGGPPHIVHGMYAELIVEE
ncbi:MAG: hypothetical protein ACR2N2_01270 [Acidimicrobiia bacterium]